MFMWYEHVCDVVRVSRWYENGWYEKTLVRKAWLTPPLRVTLGEVTFSLFLCKVQGSQHRLVDGGRWRDNSGGSVVFASRVTLESGAPFLQINTLVPLTGSSGK